VSTRAEQYVATVLTRERLSAHLVRVTLGGSGLTGFTSSGVPDEWVGLIVPGQFQSRYYTVRSWTGSELTLDVVVHDHGLVTEWVSRDCVGEAVTVLVGDLTALPAMARIAETSPLRPLCVWAEVPDDLGSYIPAGDGVDVTWLAPPGPEKSALASLVERLEWPAGPGYFWMAGESAQMRAIRKHLMRARRGTAYDVMGYWRAGAHRQPRAVDPGPIWRAGKAAGRTDEQIWADYDAARESR
jgi:NADPH-dependent ferric siderophore reductase